MGWLSSGKSMVEVQEEKNCTRSPGQWKIRWLNLSGHVSSRDNSNISVTCGLQDLVIYITGISTVAIVD